MDDSKIHELLNLSWGGPGFAAYEGRLEDEGGEGPMDSQSRAEAALAAFSGDDEEEEEAGAGEAEGDAGAGDGEGEAGGEGEGEGQAEGQLTDEQRQADPVFQELTTFRDEMTTVFDKHGIAAAAEAEGTTAAEQADRQLQDAQILYAIMNGKGTPSRLLDSMIENTGWQKAQIDVVANDLMGWLKKQGYLKGDAAAGAGKGAGAGKDGALPDPLEERIKGLETAAEKRERQEQERVVQVERDRVGKVFTDHVEKLSKAAGIAKEDIPFYATQIAALVNGSKAITDRVAKGNFVDIKKFFDTVHNRELQRLDRYNKAQLAKQKNKGKNPKTSAGGSPAASAGQAKRPLTTREDRLAAASDMLKG